MGRKGKESEMAKVSNDKQQYCTIVLGHLHSARMLPTMRPTFMLGLLPSMRFYAKTAKSLAVII